jgi:hypothetical protein
MSSRNPLRVRRIEDPHDPYLQQALDLNERIPENERNSSEDIVRWLCEIKLETAEGRCKFQDYPLVALVKKKVVALLSAQFYPE